MSLLSRLIPDRFIAVLLLTIALASVLPVSGAGIGWANLAASAAVFLIFLLHGIRLPRSEVWAGIANWRVQGALSLFIFVAFPAMGWALATLLDGAMPPLVAMGFIYAGVLPTTVQSATTYTALAKGDVAISVVASALNNLAAVLLTPLLFALIAGRAGGVTLSWELAVRIALILLLPFGIGQLVQRWARPWAMRHAPLIKLMDQSAIAIAVYVAFSAAVVGGLWQRLGGGELAALAGGVALLLGFGFGGAWALGRWLKLPLPQRSAVLFAASHKSIAVGAPLAAILFAPAAAGMLLLPVLFYHLAQLILSAWIAPVLARKADGAPMS